MKSFVLALPAADLVDLNRRVELGAAAESAWLAEQRKRRLDGLKGRAASEVRRALRHERQQLREAGHLLGTREAAISHALRSVLTRRGLMRDWPAPPAGATTTPGRPWGSVRHSTGDAAQGRLDARMELKVPAALGETLVRAAYWSSAEAVAELQAWAEEWGDGPAVKLVDALRNGLPGELAMLAALVSKRATPEAMRKREAARARILTTGALLREAVVEAIGDRAAVAKPTEQDTVRSSQHPDLGEC